MLIIENLIRLQAYHKIPFLVAILFVCFMCQNLSAQFDEIPDTIVCDAYELPIPAGQNLSNNIIYALESDGSGTQFVIGDEITETNQVFVIDLDNGYVECFLVIVIQDSPSLHQHDDVLGCRFAYLPIIQGNNLTSQAAYYTESGGKGQKLYASSIIHESTTLYIYDGIANCASEDTIEVLVPYNPIILDMKDTFGCAYYVFPPIKGEYIPGLAHYVDQVTSISYNVGDTLWQTANIEIVADTAGCVVRHEIDIRVNDAFIPEIADTTVCVELKLFDANDIPVLRYSFFQFEGKIYSAIEFNQSGTYIVIDSFPGTSCSYRDTFELEVIKATVFNVGSYYFNTIENPDTLIICNESEVNLYEFFKASNYASQFCIIEAVDDFDFDNPLLDATSLDLGFYRFLCYYENDCDAFLDSIYLTIQIVDDCSIWDERYFSFNCDEDYFRLAQFLIRSGIYYGGQLFNEDFSEELIFSQEAITKSATDTLIYHYIYSLESGEIDTSTFGVSPNIYNEIEFNLDQDTIELCYGDCLEINLHGDPNVTDTIVFWNHTGGELAPDGEYIYNNSSAIGILGPRYTVCYQEISQDFIYFDDYINEESKTYFIIYDPYDSADDGIAAFNNNQYCYENKIADTLFIKTLNKNIYSYQKVLCPNEELEIAGVHFDKNHTTDTIKLSNAGFNGCDSLIYVALEYDVTSIYHVERHYCDSDAYIYFDCNRYDIDQPSDTITYQGAAKNGCDSLVYINLHYYQPIEMDSTIHVCMGDSVLLGGDYWGIGDQFVDTILNTIGCDSIYRLYFIELADEDLDEAIFETEMNCSNQAYQIELVGDYQMIEWSTGTIGPFEEGITSDSIQVTYVSSNACSYDTVLYLSYSEQFRHTGNLDFCIGNEVIFSVQSNHDTVWINDKIYTGPFSIDHDTLLHIQYLDVIGCEVDTFLQFMHHKAPLIATDDILNQAFIVGMNLPVSYTGEISTYNWFPSDGLNCFDCAFPVLLDAKNATYYVTVTNEYGCIDFDSIQVRFKESNYYLPNIISVNSDIFPNDRFFLQSNYDLTYDLLIYDRWGNMIFDKNQLQANDPNQGWIPGNKYVKGVYVYLLRIQNDVGEEEIIQGSITVI